MLLCILTGDWRDSKSIVYLVPAGAPKPTFDEVLPQVQHALISVLASTKFTIWPRHRWTGAQAAITSIALFDVLHMLLVPVVQTWMQIMSSSAAVAHALSAIAPAVPLPLVEDGGPIAETAFVAHDREGLAEDVEEDVEETWAQKNAKQRLNAWQWVRTKPFGHLLAMVLLLRPFTHIF
eukprot:6481893-Amphidinium_carterae.1